MFPDLSRLNINRPTEGKAFSVFVEKVGCAVQRREMHVKQEEWNKCEECESFDRCYHLSAAKTLLWQGLLAAA
jgi:hypothetical protein